MARLKINLPAKFMFTSEFNIRISDINYGGHLGNDAVLSLAHELRLLYLQSMGFSELNCGGSGIIMTDAQIVYMSEAFHGDLLTGEIACENISAAGLDFVYRFISKKSGKEIARIKTGIVFFDYKNRKIMKTPAQFLEKINQK